MENVHLIIVLNDKSRFGNTVQYYLNLEKYIVRDIKFKWLSLDKGN